MALNSEVHPDVPTIDYEEWRPNRIIEAFEELRREVEEEERRLEEEERRLEEERRRKFEEEWTKYERFRRGWFEELWRKEKRNHWKLLQLRPTVYLINKVDWMCIGKDYWDVGMSLGISSKVLKKVQRSAVDDDMAIYPIESMLTGWLNHAEGTGNKKRTWGTICTAIANECSHYEALLMLCEVIDIEGMYAKILSKKPTLQEIEALVLHYLGEDWDRVGQLLGMSPKVMKEIGSKFGSIPTQCSEAMFSKWLNHEEGTGHKERTWGTVLTALEDAGRGDLAISVLDKLMVKHKKERALKKAPNIKEMKDHVIPHVARMWWAIGRFLGIIKAILIAIGIEARKKVSLKQTCEMFQLWLDGREGTGDEDRSWFVILRVLTDIGRSDIIFEIQEHFDLKTKDIARGCCSKSLSESSGSEVYTDPLPRLGSKRSCSEGSMGESSHATVEESSSTHFPPQSNGDHFTWSEPKRRHLEEDLDKRGKFPSNQPARSRRRQKWKKLNGLPSKLVGLDKKGKCFVTSDLRDTLKRRKKKSRRCLSEKSGHSGKHSPDQPVFSGQKRSPTSGDVEESGHKKRPYDNVSVNVVVQKITRKKLHGGIMGMLNGQRIRLLCDDCKLINRKCKNIILGFEKKNDIEEAADELIDYFQKTHTGEELLMFARFLRKEAEDDGQNPQLLNLAKSIEDAVYTAFHENQ